jgi:hypothetical protein
MSPHSQYRRIPAGNPAFRWDVFSRRDRSSEMEEAMTVRRNVLVLALGGLAIAGVPTTAANAQSGDALVKAEHTCLDYGMRPRSSSFNACVDRVALSYDRGEPGAANAQARTMGNARATCLSYGLDSRTLGFQQCMSSEIDRDGVRAYSIYVPPPVVDTYVIRYAQ